MSQKSKIDCFAEAMRITGKSEETIRYVYEAAAERMTSPPGNLLEKWRNWYWRSSEDVCCDAHPGGASEGLHYCATCNENVRTHIRCRELRITWMTRY